MWDWINGGIKKFENKVIIEPGNELFSKNLAEYFAGVGHRLWNWTIEVLPDLVGYGTMATGAFIILGSMTGRDGMMKPLAYLSGGVILSLCVLMTARG